MNAIERAAIWDDVWAEYDARQEYRCSREGLPPVGGPGAGPCDAGSGVGGMPAAVRGRAGYARTGMAPGGHGGRAGVRPMVQVAAAGTAALALLGLWLLIPVLLAVRLSVPLGMSDAPGLLRQFDAPVAMASLREGLQAEVAREPGMGAQRFLSGMADRMVASWERPERVAAWMAVRARGGRGEGSPVALSNLRSARPVGLTSFRLEYGPAGEAAGVAFDVSWQGDGFRVTGLRFLDVPTVPVGTVVAMR